MKQKLFILLVVLLLATLCNAGQTPAPCAGWFTYGSNDVPFAYDANLCRPQIIGWAEVLKGKKVSWTVNACSEIDTPIILTLLNPQSDMTLDNWRVVWQTTVGDLGVYYVHFRIEVPNHITEATVPVLVKHDERPRFGPITDVQIAGKKPKQHYADIAIEWLNE